MSSFCSLEVIFKLRPVHNKIMIKKQRPAYAHLQHGSHLQGLFVRNEHGVEFAGVWSTMSSSPVFRGQSNHQDLKGHRNKLIRFCMKYCMSTTNLLPQSYTVGKFQSQVYQGKKKLQMLVCFRCDRHEEEEGRERWKGDQGG